MTGTERFAPLVFQYAIGLGVRKQDSALKTRLNEILGRERETIHALLASYGVPLVSPKRLTEGSAHE
jgi:mxaJ protein